MTRSSERPAPGDSGRGVSVIICAYTERRREQLAAAIASAWNQTARPIEVVVAVDHNPEMEARLREDDALVVVPNRHVRGLSGARNSALEVARGEIVAFLDDDAYAEPEWLERMLAWYADESVAGVGGRIEPEWGVDGRPGGFPHSFDWVVGCSYEGMPTNASPVRNLIGANMSFRRSVFDAVGGFRAEIGRVGTRPLGGEETELCIRASQQGLGRFIYEPGAIVHHHVPSDRQRWGYFLSRCYSEGLSKARIARLVGNDGLASERAHARKTLTRSLLRDAARAVTRFDRGAATRFVATASGSAAVVAGLLRGSLVREGRDRHSIPVPEAIASPATTASRPQQMDSSQDHAARDGRPA